MADLVHSILIKDLIEKVSKINNYINKTYPILKELVNRTEEDDKRLSDLQEEVHRLKEKVNELTDRINRDSKKQNKTGK